MKYRTIYEDLYEKLPYSVHYLGFIECTYCGEAADTMDHVPPISRVDDYRALNMKHELYLKVACCKSCNSRLGNSLQNTLLDRISVAKSFLEKKYKKELKVAVFTKDELKEFSGTLKRDIIRAMERREYLLDLLDYSGGEQTFIDFLEKMEITDEIDDYKDE